MKFLYILFFVFIVFGCTERTEFANDSYTEAVEDKVITIATVSIDGENIPIELKSNSTITFTDKYMIVSTGEDSTRFLLDGLSNLTYNLYDE